MNVPRGTLTQKRLREVLHYDPETGIFRWRISRPGCSLGAKAGQQRGNGNPWKIMVDRQYHTAHRLAFLYMEGRFPKGEVDHINCNRLDNRWANLRHATRSQNQRNTPIGKRNSSGFKGVSWDRTNSRWRANIQHEGRAINLGRYDTPERAYEAYCAAAKCLHGDFARFE